MQFLNPIWLAGLTGLLVPIGIHLLSRKESNVIPMGSLRHLQETNTRRSVSLKLNEIVLLILRSLIVALVVFLLSGLYLAQQSSTNWVVIEDGLETDATLKPIMDSLGSIGYETHQLSDGFPALSAARNNKHRPDYWKLTEHLAHVNAENIVVFAHNYASGFSGKRIALPTNVKWISKDAPDNEFTVFTKQISPDSVFIRTARSNGTGTLLESETKHIGLSKKSSEDTVFISPVDTISVTIAFDKSFSYDANLLEASIRAIDDISPDKFIISKVSTDNLGIKETSWLIWLSDKIAPELTTTQLIIQQSSTRPILQRSADHWIIGRLTEEVALKEKLPLLLAEILLPSKLANNRLQQLDRRTLSDQLVWSDIRPTTTAATPESSAANASGKWLTCILLFLIGVERLVAFKRNQ